VVQNLNRSVRESQLWVCFCGGVPPLSNFLVCFFLSCSIFMPLPGWERLMRFFDSEKLGKMWFKGCSSPEPTFQPFPPFHVAGVARDKPGKWARCEWEGAEKLWAIYFICQIVIWSTAVRQHYLMIYFYYVEIY